MESILIGVSFGTKNKQTSFDIMIRVIPVCEKKIELRCTSRIDGQRFQTVLTSVSTPRDPCARVFAYRC
jgi:hypothetical protein